MSGGFVKIYESILTSSVWMESHATVRVWLTMLARADANGYVAASVPGLAYIAHVTREECEGALTVLLSPDADSRTKDHDGRRIEAVDGGWVVLNHRKYRDLRTQNQVSAADRVQKHRETEDQESYVYYAKDGDQVKIGLSKNPWARLGEIRTARPAAELVATERGDRSLERTRHEQFGRTDFRNNVRGAEWFQMTAALEAHIHGLNSGVGNAVVASVAATKAAVTIEAEAEAKTEEKKEKQKPAARAAVKGFVPFDSIFEEAWAVYPKRPGNSKSEAWVQWLRRVAQGHDPLDMLEAARRYGRWADAQEWKDGRRGILMAKTFYGPAKRFMDDWETGFPISPQPIVDEYGCLTAYGERVTRPVRIA